MNYSNGPRMFLFFSFFFFLLEIGPILGSSVFSQPIVDLATNAATVRCNCEAFFAVKLGAFMLQSVVSRARSPVRPPPIWESVNGSRDPLFRGVSYSSLSINNLLCGLEDLYFLSNVLSSVVTIRSIYHLGR